jgi:hypothetical protein
MKKNGRNDDNQLNLLGVLFSGLRLKRTAVSMPVHIMKKLRMWLKEQSKFKEGRETSRLITMKARKLLTPRYLEEQNCRFMLQGPFMLQETEYSASRCVI